MQLENLLLRKEEIPIFHENCFQIPIHPRLLDSNVDKDLASKVFPKAAEEWYDELTAYSKDLEDEKTKIWIDEVFLKNKPKIVKECGNQMLDTLYWEDRVFTSENGFATSLSISRNSGGTLYFKRDFYCQAFCAFDSKGEYVRFSRDKALEFNIKDQVIKLGDGSEGVQLYVYAMHNVDHYPGALFLRNWVLLYLNEAMKQVLK